MRSILIFIFCLIFSLSVYAQDSMGTCIKLAPLGLPWKIHLDIEQMLTKTISVGANVQYYYYLSFADKEAFSDYGSTNALKIDIYSRFYIRKHAPTGWYLAPFIGYGSYKVWYWGSSDLIRANNYFRGGGLSFGNQSKIGNSGFLIDISAAIQIYSDYSQNQNTQHFGSNQPWDLGGKSGFAPRLSLGFVF